MTHDELLARIDEDEKFLEQYFGAKFKGQSALRAVVELHSYFGRVQEDLSVKVYCIECSEDDRSISIPYPCPTIQAIEKELE